MTPLRKNIRWKGDSLIVHSVVLEGKKNISIRIFIPKGEGMNSFTKKKTRSFILRELESSKMCFLNPYIWFCL